MKFFTDIDLKRNELQNAVIQNLATHPPDPPKGLVYFNTTDNTYYGWNGTDWIDLGKLAVGDMVKFIYDKNDNDIVDKAENIDDGTYSSTAEEVRDAVTKKHTHSNKDLLDTYTQTEADLADAVTKKHTKNDDQYLDYSGDNRVSASEIKEAINELDAHKDNTNNPHQVTASQVGAAPTTHTHSGSDITSAVSNAEKVNSIYFRINNGQLEFSTDGTTYTPVEGTGGSGSGDMLKSVYDTDNDGIVDNAEKVNSIYFRITEGVLEYSLDGTTYTPVEGTGGSSGDMLKSVYDIDDDGIVDKAEAIDNGTYSATAQEIEDAVNKKHSQNTDTYLDKDGSNEVSASSIKSAITDLTNHISDADNPHQVTYSQVGAAPATHTHSGSDITSSVNEAENTDTVDGKHATDFALATHTHSGEDITSAVSNAEKVNGIHFRNNEGELEYSLDGIEYTPVSHLGSDAMLKSEYDIDEDGIVDNAEKVNSIYFRVNDGVLEYSLNGTTYTAIEGIDSDVIDSKANKVSSPTIGNFASLKSDGDIQDSGKKASDFVERNFKTATITTNWSGSSAPYTQEITISGITADNNPIISPVYSDDLETAIAQQTAWNLIGKIVTNTNKIICYCFSDIPGTEIPILLWVI